MWSPPVWGVCVFVFVFIMSLFNGSLGWACPALFLFMFWLGPVSPPAGFNLALGKGFSQPPAVYVVVCFVIVLQFWGFLFWGFCRPLLYVLVCFLVSFIYGFCLGGSAAPWCA